MQPKKTEIAILDFGSQYTHLIARRIRELGVITHIYSTDVAPSELSSAAGIILSGGPQSLVANAVLPYNPGIFSLGIPVLGLCYGHQLLAHHFDGQVVAGVAREYGLAELTITKQSQLFSGISSPTTVWMSHGDHVEKLPRGFVATATTGNRSIAAMENSKNHFYGLQFHPEVAHSKQCTHMLKNFVFSICAATKNWNSRIMEQQIEDRIKQEAGTKNVFLLVSGGVDSLVCFALLQKILGPNRVRGLHIETGLMRDKESQQITRSLKKLGYKNLRVVSAEKEFFTALRGVTDPETKRRIIGDLFLDLTDRIMVKQKLNSSEWLLGQGTIYPDTIESGGTKNADLIKTHHNRVPRVQQMIAAGRIIEPLKELYKDEVRTLGKRLGLPAALVERHPFPGPGLAIRALCSPSNTNEPVEHLAEVPLGHIYRLPVRSVGVQGDERTYAHPALLTGSPYPKTSTAWNALSALSVQTTNQNKTVNRFLIAVSGNTADLMSGHIHAAFLTKKRITLLQKIDSIVLNALAQDKKTKHIWQLPVVLIPFGHRYGESIVLRPVESSEAMTANFGHIHHETLAKICARIAKLKAIDFVLYDLTNKPPGTIEWE